MKEEPQTVEGICERYNEMMARLERDEAVEAPTSGDWIADVGFLLEEINQERLSVTAATGQMRLVHDWLGYGPGEPAGKSFFEAVKAKFEAGHSAEAGSYNERQVRAEAEAVSKRWELTRDTSFGPALWADGECRARIYADLKSSRVDPETGEAQWEKDARFLLKAREIVIRLADALEAEHGDAATLRGFINTYRMTPLMMASRAERAESERDRLREEIERLRGQVLWLQGIEDERDALRSDLATRDERIKDIEVELEVTRRELKRWRHGKPVEGDYVCPDSVELEAARKVVEAARTVAMATAVEGEDFVELVEAVGIYDAVAKRERS